MASAGEDVVVQLIISIRLPWPALSARPRTCQLMVSTRGHYCNGELRVLKRNNGLDATACLRRSESTSSDWRPRLVENGDTKECASCTSMVMRFNSGKEPFPDEHRPSRHVVCCALRQRIHSLRHPLYIVVLTMASSSCPVRASKIIKNKKKRKTPAKRPDIIHSCARCVL